jgi:superfamily II DNA helicase RecQ
MAPAFSRPVDPEADEWTLDRICSLVQDKFGKRPCWYQVEVARAIYHGKDVLGCVPTGAGKTLSFWIALLMAIADGVKKPLLFVISPLNVLAKQNVAVLQEAGISAIAVSAENAMARTFKVSDL